MNIATVQARSPLPARASKLPLAEKSAASDLDVDVLVAALEAVEAADMGIDVVTLMLGEVAEAAADVDEAPLVEEAPLAMEEPPAVEEADTTPEALGLAINTPPNMAPGSLAEAD
jgi:hypothetical protein